MKTYTFDELYSALMEANNWVGYLDHLSAYENDEHFFEEFFSHDLEGLVQRVCYGEYRFTDEWVTFDGYGNFKTMTDYEYRELLGDSAEEIMTGYAELVEDGYLEDWQGLLD